MEQHMAYRDGLAVGVDVGSVTAKAVVYDSDANQVLASALKPTGWHPRERGLEIFREALEQARVEEHQVGCVVGTGYGRAQLPFACHTTTEITCHATAVRHLVPGARTVIDVGGQDCKVIALDPDGRVRDFAMNDRCAAGTGRFLEVMARALEVDLDGFGRLALASDRPAAVSSMCTVFAESEVISLLAGGAALEDVVAGIHEAIAKRILAMGSKVGIEGKVVLSGGGGRNVGLRRALERNLGYSVEVSPHPQLAGALGAALVAASRLRAVLERVTTW